ncbi:hypothetical protein [Alteraurantiacibacter buctensis]|uniref:DUF4268 domain-containing protein n=1 Tax=Alteraurantiacibacter buctensis TaxID=1503981 RepID=A0A844YRT5_9SPHN|nr:hypothetical protein [Alteraurantiacibacter buctensis]MXO70279.1 hypothetical protein [Alteraurantiacibacter buctensis]
MTLVLVDDETGPTVVHRVPQGIAAAEHPLRDIVFAHPQILPLHELEPEIGRIIPVAIEVNLPGAGFVDVLLVSEYGRLIIVECKLWRNPQARREVVGQILDYARELARYGYEDLQRVISSRLGRRGNVLYELAAAAGSPLAEADFVDRVSRDLEAGRFLLIIAGDGITEGTRRIGEYLGAQAGLAFDLGLVEIVEYRFDDPLTGTARRILQPRLLARTQTIERYVIRSEVPGVMVDPVVEEPDPITRARPEVAANHATWRAFVTRFVDDTAFDDPAQMPARHGGLNWMRLPMPGPVGLTLYRSGTTGNVGAFLRYRDGEGLALYEELLAQREAIDAEFAAAGLPAPEWTTSGDERHISVLTPSPAPWDAAREEDQRQWLARAANAFVNIVAPRITRALG